MLKQNIYFVFVKLFISVITIAGITHPQYSSAQTKSKNNRNFLPAITVFHESPDSSEILVNIKSDELLYIRQNAGSEFNAKMKIEYRIYKNGTKIPSDTGSILISDIGNSKNKTLIARKKIKLESGQSYQSEFKCEDVNRSEKITTEIFINKENSNNPQYFLLMNENMQPIFTNTTGKSELWMAHPRWKNEELWVRYYNKKFNIPSPPFSDNKIDKFSFRADSMYKIQINDSGYVKLKLASQGFYHFQKDTSKQEGYTLYIYSGNYPEITLKTQLAEPLRYLTSSSEFEKISKGTDVKKEVDAFWLDKCGSKERARETIKQYYGRVEYANKNYTSFTEGWKTDRGMISIIFGEPHNITKTADSEIWYYNNDRAYSYISFTFIKVGNPFSDNDYILTRDPGFKPQWYRAVESWRQGRAYNANNF